MSSHSINRGGLDSNGKKTENNQPSPADLEAFLSWACGQLEIPFIPVINKITLSDAIRGPSPSAKGNKEEVTTDTQSVCDSIDVIGRSSSMNTSGTLLYFDAVYDNSDNLVQLKFNRNSTLSVIFLKLLSLIAQFQPYLTAIYISQGLTKSGLYQLSKVVNAANITDVILDKSFIIEANYYILLNDNTPVKYLSLAKCQLNDTAVQMLCSRLEYPSKASKTLSILNLSSNRITDKGATYLGNILRTNRQLAYLNLAGNLISDIGADCILSSLMTFPLTRDEINKKKARKFIYVKEKKKIIQETVKQMRIDFCEKKLSASKRKNSKMVPNVTKRIKSVEAIQDIDISLGAIDTAWLEKAEAAAEQTVAPFQDPFTLDNLLVTDDILYCCGNNALCGLNLAYNNLTYYSVKKLHTVVSTQHNWCRKPAGLITVCIDGNKLPINCEELSEIDVFFEIKLARMQNASAIFKKKSGVGRTK